MFGILRDSACRWWLATTSRSILVGLALGSSVSSATAAPSVSSTNPADQAIGISLAANVTIFMNGLVDPATVNSSTLRVSTSLRGSVSGTTTWYAPARRITFDPVDDFLAGERVFVTMTTGIRDAFGDPLPNGHHFQFNAWTAWMPDAAFVTADTTWSIGSIAFALSLGDLDGDRLPEVVFANSVPDSLTILTPDGAGGFAPFAQLPTGILPRQSAIFDLDGDGLSDIVTCASGPNEVDVFINQGGGQFAPRVGYPCGETPYGIFAGDVDADGDLDAVTANFNSHDITILENLGGSFAAPVSVSAGPQADSPRYVDGVDLDGDGDLDLACCNGYSYDVTVFLNDGTGSFTAQTPLYPVGDSPNFLEARDYDADGIPDLVTVNSVSASISFLRGNGDGTFQPAVDTATQGSFPFGIQSVDLDGDFDLDLLVPIRGISAWRAMRNDGLGGFTRGQLHVGGNHCHSIGGADWDHDGDIDVVAGFAVSQDMYAYEQVPTPVVVSSSPPANFTGAPIDDDVSIWFNTQLAPGMVVPSAFQVVGTQSGPHAVTAQWVSMERKVVLTPVVPFVPGEIVMVTSDGTGALASASGAKHAGHTLEFMTEGAVATLGFGESEIPLPGSDPVALAAADLDADGVSDLAVANYLSGDVTILLTGGAGLPEVSDTVPVGVGPLDVAAGDLDGDGALDLIVANVISRSISLLANDGAGGFPGVSVHALAGSPFALSTADFDTDGDMDLAVAEVDPDGLRICWNDGTGAFPTSDVLPVAGAPYDLAHADLDNDGDIDLVAIDSANNRIEVFLEDPTVGFMSIGTFGTGNTPVRTFPWDTNGDGLIDLLSSDYASGGISVLENLGNAAFAPAFSLASNQQPHGIWGADLTGDGELDLVTANSAAADVSVFRNLGGGIFDVGMSLPAGVTPYAVVGADWNQDGRIDLAVVNRTSGTLSVLLNGVSVAAPELGSEGGLASGLLNTHPNPFRDAVSVQLGLARAGDVTLRVFDLRGRAVVTLEDGGLPAGTHEIAWNGRDGGGNRVAAGVYFLRLDADGRSWTRKVLRLR